MKITETITGRANISVLKITGLNRNRDQGTYVYNGTRYIAVRITRNAFVLTGDYAY